MSISEVDFIRLQLENANLKLRLIETQMQLLHSQHVLTKQEVEKYGNELSILDSKDSVKAE